MLAKRKKRKVRTEWNEKGKYEKKAGAEGEKVVRSAGKWRKR